ncbi:MAG: alginate lyase family protein [Gemmatimonadota bacterium]|nr:alginate lyase family protein [Gemmatimonadota bacterium]
MPPEISRSRMRSISNKDLFAAIDLKEADLKPVRKAVKAGKWKRAAAAWGEYFSARKTPLNMVAPTGDEPDPDRIREAERVVAHEIQGWHDLTYKFGKTVDFNANWGRSGIYGTHYWGWSECLRVAFGQTGDPRYAECFDELFNQWYEQRNSIDNPAHHDVIFYELGLGGRTPRFIDHYFAYRSTGILRPVTHRRMLKSILGAGRWLYLLEKDEGYRSGNWQMCGSWALVYAGGLFPEFKEARRWVKIGVKRLLEHVDRDFYADGCHHERASGYGSWCTRISEDLLAFSDRIPYMRMETDLRASIVRMYDWFLSTTSPLGESQGFNDGGIGPQEGILRRAAELTGDGRYLWPVRERIESDSRIRPKKPDYTSIDRRPSGFAVMRSDWNKDARYLILNYGPWGGGHTHNDLLDFELYAHGEPLAVEATRWGPYDNPLDQYFRSPQAHNQLVVNDAPMDRVHHRGEDVAWATGSTLDYFSSIHRGWEGKFGTLVERRVTFLKPDCFLVSDAVFEGPQHHAYTWYLHAPARWKGSRSRLITTGRPGLQVVPAEPSEIHYVRLGTSYEARDGTPGRYPNRYWVGLQKWVRGEGANAVVYDVALVPFKSEPDDVNASRRTAAIDGRTCRPEVARGVRIQRGDRADLVVYGMEGESVECDGLSFSGKVCVLSFQEERPVRVAALDGGDVSYNGLPLIRTKRAGLTERELQASSDA